MSDIKLLPCPFCGGEAEFHRTPIKANGGWCDSVVVRCKECEARTNRVLYNKEKHGADGEYDEAAVAWNNRKPMNKATEAIEIIGTGGDTVGETHTGTIHGSAGGRTGFKPPDPAGRRPAGEDGRKGVHSI